jgi:hypothetical protein
VQPSGPNRSNAPSAPSPEHAKQRSDDRCQMADGGAASRSAGGSHRTVCSLSSVFGPLSCSHAPKLHDSLPRIRVPRSPQDRAGRPSGAVGTVLAAARSAAPTAPCAGAFCHLTSVLWTSGSTWWPQRGGPTRPHSELGRETPLRPGYCPKRGGRAGRRQVEPGVRAQEPHSGRPSHRRPPPRGCRAGAVAVRRRHDSLRARPAGQDRPRAP